MKAICCPNCGCQYLPAEIFLPNYFLGKPENVIKDDAGKILVRDGIDQNLAEEYICDKCDQLFYVEAHITYDVKSGKHVTKIEKK